VCKKCNSSPVKSTVGFVFFLPCLPFSFLPSFFPLRKQKKKKKEPKKNKKNKRKIYLY
jgi:preprotein translocase subunit YajC